MVVCHCRVVSDRRVLAELADGACTVEDVRERCGATSKCGGCLPAIEMLVAGTNATPVGIAAA
jgi:bacterioferritin-associated ferredoxin